MRDRPTFHFLKATFLKATSLERPRQEKLQKIMQTLTDAFLRTPSMCNDI